MKKQYKKVKTKLKKLTLKPALSRASLRKRSEKRAADAIGKLPQITNETVAEHREEVLASARKYKYPLPHSKRRVIVISGILLSAAVVVFFAYSMLALYKFQSTSSFIYGVTRVSPFPVAKAGSHFVSYESYLFELRHVMNYYSTQQNVDFESESGKQQLAVFKQQSMDLVINNAYVKELASKHDVHVTNKQIDQEIAMVRSQNRLGSSEQVFHDVLRKFWGWSESDFRRQLRDQLLAQQVVAKLDTATNQKAQDTLNRLNAGADFAELARQVSDDPATKANGGDYGIVIARSNPDLAPAVIEELFKLQPGQHSQIINTGYRLEIVKVNSVEGDKVKASHISFNLQDIEKFISPLRAEDKPFQFIGLSQPK
jgi:hypothetical protein